MNLAPGVSFYPEEHEYFFKGKKLSGVTGRIASSLKIRMPETFVEEHRIEGVHVHRAIQEWIETGKTESLHPGVAWITETFLANYTVPPEGVYSEVLVSDFSRYASAVDIAAEYEAGGENIDIYDIKKGKLNRDYVSLQLGIYKYLIEKYAGRKVVRCCCICVKDREYYPVIPARERDVERVLYG
jgi:hypothetical protein